MVLTDDLTYETVSTVLDSWERCRQVKGFEEKVGTSALLKYVHPGRDPTDSVHSLSRISHLRLFEKEPQTKKVFGFAIDYNPSGSELGRMGILIHAIRMIHMFDAALNMLGPDTDTLRDVLQQLGKRHIRYGVKPAFFPYMGKALLETLAETLGDYWTPEMEAAWTVVYEQLSGEIMRSILNGL